MTVNNDDQLEKIKKNKEKIEEKDEKWRGSRGTRRMGWWLALVYISSPEAPAGM